MTKKKESGSISRRKVLINTGLSVGAVAALGLPDTVAATTKVPHWDMDADVVIVGSGCAACTAAITARALGASVLIFEKMPVPGGTTAKSGGGAWIPNNLFMNRSDNREDCLRYMARYAYPKLYDADSKTLGLPDEAFQLLASFYDNGSKMIEWFIEIGAVKFRQFRMFESDIAPPDYCNHLPENKGITGRTLDMAIDGSYSISSGFTGGRSMINQMEQWLLKKNVPIHYEHKAISLIKDGEKVIGLEVKNGNKLLRVRARKGVIFGTGGYSHNPELVRLHQPGLYGSCAAPGATGDFISIAQQAGAKMGDLSTAWRSQVIFEQALESRVVAACVDFPPGDSMFYVNKYGKRVVNEKRNYNDRTRAHFAFDAVNAEYPNQLMFMVFDERTLNRNAGAVPLPADKRESTWLIEGRNSQELAQNIKSRLAALAKIGSYTLADNFATNLDATIKRFNAFAEAGRDEDFDRGLHEYDQVYMKLFSRVSEKTTFPDNDKPNSTMYPLDRSSMLYAIILAAGALDTSGGPAINANAQVLSANGDPMVGLYGAGNCVACPTGPAYMGAGGSIGPAMTFGYQAARHALEENR